jgi:AmmeMemoRadiSam system protein A
VFKIIMNIYVQLARSAIEKYIETGKIISVPENLPGEFYKKNGGVFVTIRKRDELRGCVGTYLPFHDNLAEEIIHNAISAATQDDRFFPINAREMPSLNFEVSVLGKPEKIKDTEELNPQKFGVIVKSSDGRCGLLLPGLEGINNGEEQLFLACQKAGINPKRVNELGIYRFETKKYSE